MSAFVKRFMFFYFIIYAYSANAVAINVNLNDFYADPTVTVSADGTLALLAEDSNLSTVLLSNDPFFGDPGILVPAGLLSLTFNYSFVEAANNDDEFYAWIFDGDTGDLIDEFFIAASSSGNVTWNLSGLDPLITLLGLEFQLNALSSDNSLDSTLEISNIHLTTSSTNGTNTVPEPSHMLLFAIGIIGLLGTKIKRIVG